MAEIQSVGLKRKRAVQEETSVATFCDNKRTVEKSAWEH
jgi:hypothetical protein